MKKPVRTVSETEVKQNLEALLEEVAQGMQIAITRAGQEVARLVPGERPRLSDEEFLRRAAELRAQQPLHQSRSEDLVREDRDR